MQYKNGISKKYGAIWLLLSALSFITSTLIATDNTRPEYYGILWLLPLSFIFCYSCILFISYSSLLKISTILITSIYGLRMVIVPLCMYYGDYVTFGDIYYLSKYMNKAIILMCWELFVITFFIIYVSRRNMKYTANIVYDNNNTIVNVSHLPYKFKIALLLIVIYILAIILGTPGLLKESFFLTTGRSEESYNLLFSGSVSHNAFGLSFGSQLVTIAFSLFWIIQAIAPPYFIAKVCKKAKSSRVRAFLFLLVLLFTLLICTEGRAHSIETAFSLLIATYIAYGKKIKINMPFIIIVILGVIIYGLVDKSGIVISRNQGSQEFSTMISAYCSGPQNVATALAASNESGKLGFLNIFTDILQRIPYLTKIFTATFSGTSNTVFNEFFGFNYLGQIIPSVGLGYSYFGFLFAPIVPCIAVYFSMYFERRALEVPDIVRKNLFFLGTIMMARATAMSNMLSGITYLCNFFITWLILFISYQKAAKKHPYVSFERRDSINE